ncbi:hypothetical protein [Leucothrix arctica]|uniref:DUF2214 domain-containing protein n=1 Tax=Leucothrix arctica TaxID=1481894 RepID=A0A317C7U9_9GAMM|nr:hypothetical protein [Leucothrix arctica]PWQ93443.1 hypothetical protein DKT75_17595 [Leucothrix arctica]
MEDFLFSLEDSALGMYVSSSIWGYPIVLSLHALGMAALVGVSLMLAFRALGFAKVIPVTSLASYWRIAQVAFIINLLSGVGLFLGSASELAYNIPFLIKIVLVFVGLFLTQRLVNVCINGDGDVKKSDRNLAAWSVIAWVGALITGRLIGYVL